MQNIQQIKEFKGNPHFSARTILTLAILTAAGFTGNYFRVPLFFGVDFLFGSIAVMIAVYLYGPLWSMVIAIIASSYTYFLWGHPYAIFIFTCEALFVGLFLNRKSQNIVLLDGIFWILIGMPLIWLLYFGIMSMDSTATKLIMLKQSINGIFEALVASLIVTYLPIDKWAYRSAEKRNNPLNKIFFNLLVAFVLIPALLIMIFNSRRELHEIETDIKSYLINISVDISDHFDFWYQKRLHALTEIAQVADKSNMRPTRELQQRMMLMQKIFPEFHEIIITNADGAAMASSRYSLKTGGSMAGSIFSETPYLKAGKFALNPVISDLFFGQASNVPYLVLSVPVLAKDQLHGYVHAAVHLSGIRKLLSSSFNKWPIQTTSIDRQQHVVATTNINLEPKKIFDPRKNGMIRIVDDVMYQWLPSDKKLPEMVRWKRSYYIREVSIDGDLPWRLIIEVPALPHINYLQNIYIYNFAFMLFFILLTLFFARVLSRWLAKPLSRLAQVTTNLPDKLLDQQTINWPDSSINEMDLLVSNFKSMTATLNRKFQETKRAAGILERRFEERKKMEKQINASLREKELLLREIHHRVKNNMQIISSLLSLQSEYCKDSQAMEMFEESQNRIKSMALIHEKIYQSKNLSRINFNSYIESLANDLFISYRISSKKVVLKKNIKGILLGIDTAIPCGLIINELISNSLKHAFPDGKEGEITISFNKVSDRDQNEYELIVKDDGVGIAKKIDYKNTETLGLQLVTTLAEGQLHGTIALNRDKGTMFNIRFVEEKDKIVKS